MRHAHRTLIGAGGEDARQFKGAEARTLARHNTALQEEGDAGSPAKIAVILHNDLVTCQMENVTAFTVSGVTGRTARFGSLTATHPGTLSAHVPGLRPGFLGDGGEGALTGTVPAPPQRRRRR